MADISKAQATQAKIDKWNIASAQQKKQHSQEADP